MDLKAKVAIITGGGRGIGKTMAIELAKEGCNVVVSSRNAEELKKVAEEAESLGVKALAVPLDLSKQTAVNELVSKSIEKFGAIDILINNAAIIIPRPFLEVSIEEWDRTMDINLRSVFLLSQKVLEHMKENRKGYIINISSTAALAVPKQLASYGASKCGIVGLNQALYETAKEFGVKVSCVYPGVTDTKMLRDAGHPSKPSDWMLPEDIAYCVIFLLKQSDRMIVKDIVPWSTGYDKI